MSMFKTAVQSLKEEFKETRKELTGANLITMEGFQEMVVKDFPQYNCPEGYKIIRNVWYGRSADLNLSRAIEKAKTNLIPPVE